MPKSAVVDASVLVSAFLFPESVPGRVLQAAHHSDEAVIGWCTELAGFGRLFADPPPDIGRVCRDPNDDHVIATALAVNAEFIVTGDKDLLALSRYKSIRILTAGLS